MRITSITIAAVVPRLVRLRQIALALDGEARDEIDRVIVLLEHLVGATVNVSAASRLLGVSHTALANWIRRGDIGTVMTPEGRREVPVGQIVRLLDAIEKAPHGTGRLALAQVLRNQRRRADEFDLDTIIPKGRRSGGHQYPELRSLAYHRAVSSRLDESMVADARRRLNRWRDEDRIHPHWAGKWERVLSGSVAEIATLLLADTERARALRQSSPFAGALTEYERRRILQHVDSVYS